MKSKKPAGKSGLMERVYVKLTISDAVIVETRACPMRRWKANLLDWFVKHS